MNSHPPVPESLWDTVPPEAQTALLNAFASLEKRIAELVARLNLNDIDEGVAQQRFPEHLRQNRVA